jgi:hypothetical protein
MATIVCLQFHPRNKHLTYDINVVIGAKQTCDTPGPFCGNGSSSEPVTASICPHFISIAASQNPTSVNGYAIHGLTTQSKIQP